MKDTVYLGKYVIKQENAYSGKLSLKDTQLDFITRGVVNFNDRVLLIAIKPNGEELGKIVIHKRNINLWETRTIVDSYTGEHRYLYLLSYLPGSPFYYGG